MVDEHYKLKNLRDNELFLFVSSGTSGDFLKVILFTLLENGNWNLAFGDYDSSTNDIDDKVISNNNDIVLIMKTVVKSVYLFYENHPGSIIEITPVDEKRKLLYNTVLRRNHMELKKNFDIFGYIGKRKYRYQSSKGFQTFLVRQKSA